MRFRLSGLMAALMVATVACKGDPTAEGAGTPLALQSDYKALNVTIGTSGTFTSWVTDVRATRVGALVSFTTCSAAIATVKADTSYHPVPPTSMRAVVTSVLPGTTCVKVASPGVPDTTVTVNVLRATPLLITTPTFTTGPPGAMMNDTARVVGGFGSLAGTLTFALYDSLQTTCAASPRYGPITISIPGTGAYGTSPGFAADKEGIWRWQVVYSGNILNKPITSVCTATAGELVTIAALTPGAGPGAGSGGHGPAPVVLSTAGNYVILAKSGISNVPTSAITGNLGLSPAAASAITGFALTLDGSGTFSTSPQVTGNVYAADYTAPTPANLTAAIGNMQTAYVNAAGRTGPDHTELAAGNIGGLTLPPGLYKWSNTVIIPTNVTLSGGANDTWIFQIAGGITQASATQVILSGGALAQNVVWQATGVVDIGTTAHMEGRILSLTSITLHTGATVNGRLMAQTAVTLDGNTVVQK
jgi:ice-binding like protein